MTILDDVKGNLGIEEDNLAFDAELLTLISGAASTLGSVGVLELEDIDIDSSTYWPIFANPKIVNLVKAAIPARVKMIFDPTASAAISAAYKEHLAELETRIQVIISADLVEEGE